MDDRVGESEFWEKVLDGKYLGTWYRYGPIVLKNTRELKVL